MDINYYDIYGKAQANVRDILLDISNIYNTSISLIRYGDVRDYSEHDPSLEIIPYPFNSVTTKILSGFVKIYYGKYVMGLNTTIKSKDRQRFTFCHEFYHYLNHFGSNSLNEFADLTNDNGYSDKMLLVELEANYGASLLLCSDDALVHSMYEMTDIREFEKEFGMSNGAVSVRLYNYFLFNCNIPSERSRTLAFAYTRSSDHDRRSFVNVLINHFEEIKTELSTLEFLEGECTNEWFENLYDQLDEEPCNSHYHQLKNLYQETRFYVQ